MPEIQAVVETCLYADDLDAAVAFYRDVLGLRCLGRDERMASFSVADRQLLLLFRRGGSLAPHATSGGMIPPHDAAGPAHVGFAVASADLPAWEQRLAQMGVAVESRVAWPRGGRSLYFRDPDGHALELLTPGVWAIY